MGNIRVNFTAQGNSYLASHRMRVQKPTQLLNVGVEEITATITRRVDHLADVNVFGKHFDTEGNLEALIDTEGRYKTVFDVCDNHFDREHSDYYKSMCEGADLVTCNTAAMALAILEKTGKIAHIIPDPITFFKDKYIPVKNPQFMWYGHSSNIEPLMAWLPHVKGRIKVISDGQVNHPNIDWTGWKPLVVETVIANTDFVLIPSTEHNWVSCKSPNRAVDAIYAGKVVIADNSDVYGDLKDFIHIIDDPKEIPDIVVNVQENPKETADMIEAGQAYVEKHYGNDVVIDGWLEVLKELKVIREYSDIDDEA